MDDSRFWAIIETGGHHTGDDQDEQSDAIREALDGLPPEEVRDFHRILNQKLAAAYRWDLWGAAYLINGGCSDDGFFYFRSWLLGRGRAVYEAALQNPDSLAGHTNPEDDDHEYEDLWSIPRDAYEALTGAEMPIEGDPEPDSPAGDQWDFEDDAEVRRRLPKLAAIHLE